ncbi:RNA polymerase sigma factor [Mycobacterium sp.]|uniref:RNA polymerase sigma factor n=1 Tax=Mycobacterium sp. TaxID=1785 RepID=UPI003A83853C
MNAYIPFERAAREHSPTVLRVCRAVLGAGPDADDAYSETMLSALQHWPELPEDANVEAWLVRIAQRKTVDIIRARSRAVPMDDIGDRRAATAGSQARETELWEIVAALPERQRLAIAYHFLGGLPHAETAELIGGTAAAVRRASADGIATLRKHFRTADTPEGAPR